MDQIKQEIVKAFQGSKKLRVEGYVNSKGQVNDYDVEMLGETGYKDLVQQSFDYISTLKRPEGHSPYAWTEACQQQLASWNNALSGVAQRQSSVELTPAEGGAYALRADRPEAVVLAHLKTLATTEQKTATANHRDEVTAAKAWMRSNSPLSAYISMLILEPGKFKAVTAL